MREVEELRDKRLFMADTFRQYELQCSQEEYEREKNCALHRFEVVWLSEIRLCWVARKGSTGEPRSLIRARYKDLGLAGQAEISIGHLYNSIQTWSNC